MNKDVYMENCSQNLWNNTLRQFTANVTCDAGFLKINSFTSSSEEVWPVSISYFHKQLVLHNSSHCDFLKKEIFKIVRIGTIFYNESIALIR